MCKIKIPPYLIHLQRDFKNMAEKEMAERKEIPQCGILAREPACRGGDPRSANFLDH
jgi:hypothetical protein